MSISFPSFPRRGLCLALALGGLASLGPPAFAQETTAQGITVTAPRQVGRSAIGAPIEVVHASRVVTYGDLDLRTASGAAELDKRVAAAARDACGELETRYPIGTPDAFACAKEARASAKAPIEAAKAMAMQGAMPPTAEAAPAYAPPAAAVEPAPAPAAAPPAAAPAPAPAGERG